MTPLVTVVPAPGAEASLQELSVFIDTRITECEPVFLRRKPLPEEMAAVEKILPACDRILATDNLPEKTAVWTLRRKAVLLEALTRWEPEQYFDALGEVVVVMESYVKDDPASRSANSRIRATLEPVYSTRLAIQIRRLQDEQRIGPANSQVDFDKLAAELCRFVTYYPGTKSDRTLNLLIGTLNRLPESRRDDALLRIIRPLTAIYLGDPARKRQGKVLQGLTTRIELKGKEMYLKGYTSDGLPFDHKSLQGKVVLVDFWETTCVPCMEQMPRLIALYEKFEPRGVEFVGVVADSNAQAVNKFLQNTSFLNGKKLIWPTIVDYVAAAKDEPTIRGTYGINAYPTMFLIGKDGKVLSTTTNINTLERELEAALREPGPKEPEKPASLFAPETIPSPPMGFRSSLP